MDRGRGGREDRVEGKGEEEGRMEGEGRRGEGREDSHLLDWYDSLV